MTKTLAKANRRVVRNYWRSYLDDGHMMGWLTADADCALGGVYEAQGQTYYCGDNEVLHQFGDVHRAHGQMPKKITLRDFVASIGIGKYLAA